MPLEPHSKFGDKLLQIKTRVSRKREYGPNGVKGTRKEVSDNIGRMFEDARSFRPIYWCICWITSSCRQYSTVYRPPPEPMGQESGVLNSLRLACSFPLTLKCMYPSDEILHHFAMSLFDLIWTIHVPAGCMESPSKSSVQGGWNVRIILFYCCLGLQENSQFSVLFFCGTVFALFSPRLVPTLILDVRK